MQKYSTLYAKVYNLLRIRILAGIYKKGRNIPLAPLNSNFILDSLKSLKIL